jgi:predicted ABC-type transport system involved in lysophospholipase L1 biosynthesis ATPase subunit
VLAAAETLDRLGLPLERFARGPIPVSGGEQRHLSVAAMPAGPALLDERRSGRIGGMGGDGRHPR